MAKLADILQQERERDTADKWGIIHLFKTGSLKCVCRRKTESQ